MGVYSTQGGLIRAYTQGWAKLVLRVDLYSRVGFIYSRVDLYSGVGLYSRWASKVIFCYYMYRAS